MCTRGANVGYAHVVRRFAFHERGTGGRGERRTRARRGTLSLSLYVDRGSEREIERDRARQGEHEGERQRGRSARVNRICMETVCQWVASSCGYLTLFTSSPRLLIAHPSLLLNIPFLPLALFLSVCFAFCLSFFPSARASFCPPCFPSVFPLALSLSLSVCLFFSLSHSLSFSVFPDLLSL